MSRCSAESEPRQGATVRFEEVFSLIRGKWAKVKVEEGQPGWNQAGDVVDKTRLSLDAVRFTVTASRWHWRRYRQQTVLTTAHWAVSWCLLIV